MDIQENIDKIESLLQKNGPVQELELIKYINSLKINKMDAIFNYYQDNDNNRVFFCDGIERTLQRDKYSRQGNKSLINTCVINKWDRGIFNLLENKYILNKETFINIGYIYENKNILKSYNIFEKLKNYPSSYKNQLFFNELLKTLTVDRSKKRNTLFYQDLFVNNITLGVDSITENDMIIFKKLDGLPPLILLSISKNDKNNTLFLNKDDELKFYTTNINGYLMENILAEESPDLIKIKKQMYLLFLDMYKKNKNKIIDDTIKSFSWKETEYIRDILIESSTLAENKIIDENFSSIKIKKEMNKRL
jgi:hypothetical protein